MAEQKTQTLEREYIIPLRKEWRKVANYRRTGRAIKAIKQFIAKHMKIPNRDVSKVKLDPYLNSEIWFRGSKKPPAKIKVRAIKEKDLVKVELVEMPAALKFAKEKHARLQKPAKKSEQKTEEIPKTEEKTEDEKKEESEKEKSVAEVRAADAKQQAKAQKHIAKKKEPQIRRMALQK